MVSGWLTLTTYQIVRHQIYKSSCGIIASQSTDFSKKASKPPVAKLSRYLLPIYFLKAVINAVKLALLAVSYL